MYNVGFLLITIFTSICYSACDFYYNSSANSSPEQEPLKNKNTIEDKLKKDKNINKLSDIDAVITHQSQRFADLKKILDKNERYRIKFPGKDAKNHALGTGIAKTSWKNQSDYHKMNNYITTQIEELIVRYPGRISFGYIGDYKLNGFNCDGNTLNPDGIPGEQSDGTFEIHVWGANAGNFNYPQGRKGPFGAGQASCFSHQRAGVFGISTMPPAGSKKLLLEDDKLLSSY